MNTEQQTEVINDFLGDCIQAMIDTLPEEKVSSKKLLETITSPILMDVFRIYREGVSKKVILSELKEEIRIHSTIAEVLKGMLEETKHLLEDDPNNYQPNTTND